MGAPEYVYTDERVARQLRLEELIREFNPDPYESQEILACLLKKYRDEELDVYLTSLCKSLDRWEARNSPDEVDECTLHHDWKARTEGMP